MEYRTKSGFVLTEEMIEELADQAERGDNASMAPVLQCLHGENR